MAIFQLGALALFFALFIGRTVCLNARGIRVMVLGIGKGGRQALLEVGFLVLLGWWTIEILDRCLAQDLSLLPDWMQQSLFTSRLADVGGGAAIAAGLVIFIWALASFGTSWRVGVDHQRPGGLVTHGIFSHTRNPVFIFLDLYFIGTALIQRDLFFLTAAIAVVAGIHCQIKQEEQFLQKHYGREYERYRRRVPRYLVF
jgi:protein-S-isoprenylcysteine O-methyltransferase Ste14